MFQSISEIVNLKISFLKRETVRREGRGRPEKLLPGDNVGSDDCGRHTYIRFIRRDPAAGLAGKLHCAKFPFTDMVDTDIVLSAEGAGNFFHAWIAEMTGVISDRTTTFACMSHMKSPNV
jgi:hypothetical protein